jgi:Big-like domain-containing protein
MSFRNRTGLCGLLIGSSLAVASACGGLDSVKVIVTEDGGTGGNPSGGNGSSGKGGAKPNGGDTSSQGGAAGSEDAAGAPGNGGAAGDEASGGEGGEITVPDPMPGPPKVLAVLPLDGGASAEPLAPIRISFSEPLDPASVTSDSVQLKDDAGALVAGTVGYADAVAVFNPTTRLNLLGKYTLNVSIAVTDAGKTPMERPFTSSFTVRDGVWRRSEGSLTDNNGAFDRNSVVVLATDGVGRAMAVWGQSTDGNTFDIYSASFYQGKGWAAPIRVNTNAANCQYPNVAMNSSGSTVVGWVEYDPTLGYSVQARRSIAGVWDKASTKVDMPATAPLTTYPSGVAVAMTAKGDAHIAWLHYIYDAAAGVNYYGEYTRHANPAGTWDASPLTFAYQVGTGASQPSLAFDEAGNGFAAYQLSAGAPTKSTTSVFRYAASTAKWGTSAVDSKVGDGYEYPVTLATNPAGEAVISWVRGTAVDASNTNYELVGSYFSKAWTPSAVISNATTPISSYKTLASATWTGKGFWVTWGQSAGSSYNVYVNGHNGTSWGSAAIISDGVHSATYPWLSSDGRGNALAVWVQASDAAASTTVSPSDIGFSRFIGGGGKWTDSALASRALAGYRYPQVVTLRDGSAIAAWQSWTRPTIKTTSVVGVIENQFQ